MKIDLNVAQMAFDDVLRKLDAQVWDRCEGYVACVSRPFAQLSRETMDLDLDLDADIPDDDKVPEVIKALERRIGGVAEHLAQLPGIYAVRELKALGDRAREITIPAGCDPLCSAEIRSAVKRSGDAIRGDLAILFPAGAQDAFFGALDSSTPPEILGRRVHLQPSVELLDERVVAELFPEHEAVGESIDPRKAQAPVAENYHQRLEKAARRSPWFILPWTTKDADKPFEFRIQDRPALIGPKLSVAWRSEMAYRGTVPVVRVSSSKLILAGSVL
jgi:hypothetical protein